MLRPLTWPSSGRCKTMDRYSNILQDFMKKCVDLKYKVLKSRGLKYILQFKTQIKNLFWLIIFCNKLYVLYVITQLSDDAMSSLTKDLKKILTRFRSHLRYTTHSRTSVIPIDLFPVCFFISVWSCLPNQQHQYTFLVTYFTDSRFISMAQYIILPTNVI